MDIFVTISIVAIGIYIVISLWFVLADYLDRIQFNKDLLKTDQYKEQNKTLQNELRKYKERFGELEE